MRWTGTWTVLLAVVLAAACSQSPDPDAAGQPLPSPPPQRAEVAWETNWDIAFERAQAERKLVVVDFHADWSAWSVHMAGSVLSEPALQQILGESSVQLRLDVEGGGREHAQRHHVEHLPTVLILSPDGTELDRLVGVQRAEDLVSAITAAAAAGTP